MSPLSIAASTSFLNSNFQVYINHAPSPKQPLKCELPSPPHGSEDTPFNSLSSAANPPHSSDYSAKNLVEEILITPNGYHLKLLRIIGQGAQGVVYQAELLKSHQNDQQEMSSFAVKYVHSRALGMAEYKLHQLCDNHPNVVKLYDICTISHLPGIFLILEFCPLGSLYDHLTALNLEEERGGWFSRSSQQHWLWFDQNQEPTAQSIHLFREICQAVQHCHYRGVAHRDIKPENILLKADARGVLHAKLSDFGLATTHLDKNTEFNHGSEMYMAPEVYRTCFLKHQVNFANLNSVKMWSTTDLPAKTPVVGVGVRNGAKSEEMVKKRKRQGGGGGGGEGYNAKRADIWSLGIVLINLITGKAPWYKANFQDDLFWRFIANPFDTLSTCLDLTPEGIRVVCATLGISYGVQLAPLKQGRGRCSNPLELITWASLVKTWRRSPPPCAVLTTQIAKHENK